MNRARQAAFPCASPARRKAARASALWSLDRGAVPGCLDRARVHEHCSSIAMNFKKILGWLDTREVYGTAFICSNCGADAAPRDGYRGRVAMGIYPCIAVCPRCNYPTLLLSDGDQVPAPLMGMALASLPDDVSRFYEEARRCGSVEAWSAVALVCRTLLMHVAVDKEVAKLGAPFEACVNGLDTDNWIPTGGRDWVDAVRRVGNKAAHKADPVTKDEAAMIMHFVELLLRNVYEAPARLAAAVPAAARSPNQGGGAPP